MASRIESGKFDLDKGAYMVFGQGNRVDRERETK